jgi:hypothetical protein
VRASGFSPDPPSRFLTLAIAITAMCCAVVLLARDDGASRQGLWIVEPSVQPAPPPQSPQAVVAAWFTAVQERNVSAAIDLTSKGALSNVPPPTLRRAVEVVGPALGEPYFLSATLRRSRAVVRLLVLGFRSPGLPPVSASPLSMALVHSRNGWRIDDVGYLLSNARLLGP